MIYSSRSFFSVTLLLYSSGRQAGVAEPAFALNPYAGAGETTPFVRQWQEIQERPTPAKAQCGVSTEFPDASCAIANRATLRPSAWPDSMSNRK